MRFEEFTDCLAWWKERKENEHAWRVRPEEVLKYDDTGTLASANLDLKNPNGPHDPEHLPPEQLVDDILSKEKRIIEIIGEVKEALQGNRQS